MKVDTHAQRYGMPFAGSREIFTFDKYVTSELEYALLSGWSNIGVFEMPPFDMPYSHPPKIVLIPGASQSMIPQWGRDQADAFDLAIECGIWVKEWANRDGTIEIESRYLLRDRFPTYYTTLAEHQNDKRAAYRYAVLLAAIGRAQKMK